MHVRALLPAETALSCDSVQWNGNKITVAVSSIASSSVCPCCGHLSERIHSRYVRRLADLPWQGLRVEVHWQCRRFFCTSPGCAQHIFTERLPELAAPHARKTNRLTVVMGAIALACGGEEGARLAETNRGSNKPGYNAAGNPTHAHWHLPQGARPRRG